MKKFIISREQNQRGGDYAVLVTSTLFRVPGDKNDSHLDCIVYPQLRRLVPSGLGDLNWHIQFNDHLEAPLQRTFES